MLTRLRMHRVWPWQHNGRRHWRPRGVYLIVLIMALAGCGRAAAGPTDGTRPTNAATGPVQAGQGSSADQVVPPIILTNPAPSALDVSLVVTFNARSGDTPPMTEVGLGFQSGSHPVQFAGDEHVVCNGVALALKNRAADFQILSEPTAQAASSTVRCTYVAAGASAEIALQIPVPPVITAPRPNAQVTRGARTIVTYTYDPATASIMGVVALAPSSPMPKTVAKLNTPGPLQATLDTSQFTPVTGSIALTASLTPHASQTGASFRSVQTFGNATDVVVVSWT
ncbi:MAG TPA: hypothetical protein VJN88_10270 [Ktedonobacterales bacterium]|nr:hypothetical protein [Ktedonobacterales bacterium]